MKDLRRMFQSLLRLVVEEGTVVPSSNERAELLAQAKTLRASLRDTVKAYEEQLNQVMDLLENSTETELQKQSHQLQWQLEATKNGIHRLILAQQEKPSLTTELNEWKQYAKLSRDQLPRAIEQRLEMLESELRIRQTRLQVPVFEQVHIEFAEASQPIPALEQDPLGEALPSVVGIELWDSLQPSTDALYQSWKEFYQHLRKAEMNDQQRVQLVKEFKQAQAHIKLQDKKQQKQRHRIEVFQQ